MGFSHKIYKHDENVLIENISMADIFSDGMFL